MYRKYTQAFTLIELLAVMVIILIIAGMFVGVSGPASQSAKKRKAEVMISALEVAIGMYHSETGGYPAPDIPAASSAYINLYDELVNGTAFSGASPWRGPYMEFKGGDVLGGKIIDPWGTAYNYDPRTTTPSHAPTHNTNSFDLWSSGPDKKTSTAAEKIDDRTNW